MFKISRNKMKFQKKLQTSSMKQNDKEDGSFRLEQRAPERWSLLQMNRDLSGKQAAGQTSLFIRDTGLNAWMR